MAAEPLSWERLYSESLIYEDDRVCVLNKPNGISTQGERHDLDVLTIAEASGVTLYMVHRIDKITTGVLIFGKDQEAQSHLTRQFAQRRVEKRYLAVCVGNSSYDQFKVDLALFTASNGKVRVAAKRDDIIWDDRNLRYWVEPENRYKDSQGFDSVSEVSVVGRSDEFTGVLVKPESGRRHQIRVHLAWIGLPILGDPLFPKTSRASDHEPMLHAHRLQIQLPGQTDNTQFAAPPPKSFAPFSGWFQGA